ncbi:Ger(x)C family spore germination protein [Paenibacillus sp. GXUN7292]|uniref:Ger(x)C family spore germination protein n=1 Tax=Paenibacillus sp. GXUN7292 TaxID=3422499 RepID=UPI003D7E6FE5
MKKTLLVISLLLVIMLQTGCWSRTELNELAIAVGLGIDKVGEQYELTVQIVDPSQVSSQGSSKGFTPVVLYSSKGNSLPEAVGRLATEVPRKIYFAHLWIVVLSEEVAKKEGIGYILDYLSRAHEFRNDFYFGISRESTAKQLLGILSALERIPANKMFQSLSIAQRDWSPVSAMHLDEMLDEMMLDGKNLVLNGFRIEGDINKGSSIKNLESTTNRTKIKLSSLGAFKGDKLVGWLNESESRGYTNITNKLKRTVLVVACEGDGTVSFDVIRSKTKIELLNDRGGKLAFKVSMLTEADIASAECTIDLNDQNVLNDLETLGANQIKEHSSSAIKKAKKLGTDIFGFGEVVRRSRPAYWQTIKHDWYDIFPTIQVEITPVLKIRRLGAIGESTLNDIK